ncbi:MAG: chromate efflux transporter [Rhodoferax sp.]|nr:chromate efflux transporter [Rhodoferax sp.]
MPTATAPVPVSFREALRFWFRLGCISFGGPAGQIAIMHRELVEQRRWISERRFLHALNYCMLLPGPEAQQLATYLGWLMHRTWGGVVAGALFVMPSLLLLIGLSWGYMAYGDLPWMAAVLWGIKPAVAALVLQAVHRIGSRTLTTPRRAPLLWAIAILSFVAVALLQVPFPAVVLAAALTGALVQRWLPGQFASGASHGAASIGALAPHPAAWIDDHTPTPEHARFTPTRLARVLTAGAALWLLPLAGLIAVWGWDGTLTQMAWFFTKAALLTFGGAYAVLPYVHQGAVEHFGWLSAAQMMDGLALGESTPGPLIMVVTFVGFVGGWGQAVLGPQSLALGATLAAVVVTWFTFLPSFIFVLAGGPLIESTHGKLHFTAPLTTISAAVVGVIASLAVFFGLHLARPGGASGAIDFAALGLALAAVWALLRLKWGVVPVIALCALAGLIRHLVAV